MLEEALLDLCCEDALTTNVRGMMTLEQQRLTTNHSSSPSASSSPAPVKGAAPESSRDLSPASFSAARFSFSSLDGRTRLSALNHVIQAEKLTPIALANSSRSGTSACLTRRPFIRLTRPFSAWASSLLALSPSPLPASSSRQQLQSMGS